MAAPFLILIVYGPVLAVAGNETAPLPDSVHDQVGWQNSPSRRGTWEIVVSCMTTIFACTWSIQHLNVPGLITHDGTISKLLRSCKWMMITIFFPEFILVHAFFELIMAVQATESIKRTDKKVAEYRWLIKIFVLRDRAPNPKQTQNAENSEGLRNKQQESQWTLTHSYFANMGGLYYDGGIVRFPLTASHYAQEPDSYVLPMIREEDIKDKGKEDFFAKGLAVLQILQLVLSLIVRKTRNLPFSQLEMLTLAFAICGVGTYIAYWYKPQGIGVPIIVTGTENSKSPNFVKTYDNFLSVLRNSESSTNVSVVHRVKNDNIPLGTSQTTHMAIPLLAVMSAAFGSLHLIAWNFEFPTELEKLLWRITTVLSIAVPVMGLATIPLAQIVISAGNPRDFILDCLYVLRELSWYSHDKSEVLRARHQLENIYSHQDTKCDDAQQLYREIFGDQGAGITLRTQIMDFIEKKAPFEDRASLELPNEFRHQFAQLLDRMEEKGPKKLVDNAKTNVFPQKSLLRKEVNLFILYTTSLVYCLSRLTTMALALSSLRSMPDEVYVTTWKKNIPAIK